MPDSIGQAQGNRSGECRSCRAGNCTAHCSCTTALGQNSSCRALEDSGLACPAKRRHGKPDLAVGACRPANGMQDDALSSQCKSQEATGGPLVQRLIAGAWCWELAVACQLTMTESRLTTQQPNITCCWQPASAQKQASAGQAISCQASHHAGSQYSLCCLRLGLYPPEALLGGVTLCRGASCCSCSRHSTWNVSAMSCGRSPV